MDNVTTYYVVQHTDGTRYLGRLTLRDGYSWQPKCYASCFESIELAELARQSFGFVDTSVISLADAKTSV